MKIQTCSNGAITFGALHSYIPQGATYQHNCINHKVDIASARHCSYIWTNS